jgi:hypothetical protein
VSEKVEGAFNAPMGSGRRQATPWKLTGCGSAAALARPWVGGPVIVGPYTGRMRWLRALWPKKRPPAVVSDWQRAHDLVAAVDAGGLPLNPARVNDIARRLGLEVSTRAPVEDTVARIRAALARHRP